MSDKNINIIYQNMFLIFEYIFGSEEFFLSGPLRTNYNLSSVYNIFLIQTKLTPL